MNILTLSEKCHSWGRQRLTEDKCQKVQTCSLKEEDGDDDLVCCLNKLDDVNPVGLVPALNKAFRIRPTICVLWVLLLVRLLLRPRVPIQLHSCVPALWWQLLRISARGMSLYYCEADVTGNRLWIYRSYGGWRIHAVDRGISASFSIFSSRAGRLVLCYFILPSFS